MRTINDFEIMMPMKYYNNEDDANKKRLDMLQNKENLYIATEKHDGDWGMFIHYSNGNNLIRSRSISTVTGKYGDYTAKLPHLCEEMNEWPDNTVILAEICWDEYGTNANTVGTILRCLAAKAVERQKEKKLSGLMFDMLMYNGSDLTNLPYTNRLNGLQTFFETYNFNYFKPTAIFLSDFEMEADKIIAAGGEGCVIQRKDNPYMPGTRTAWKTLKLKKSLPSAEYKVVAALDPNQRYEGENPDNWLFWYQDMPNANSQLGDFPVTKPYFYGWKNGIRIILDDGTTTDIASGLTDADREWLATAEAQEQINAGNLYAEVKAMSINDLGKLRHGYLVRLRTKEDGANE